MIHRRPFRATMDLKFMHWNCRSLKRRASEFKKHLLKNMPHVVALQETFCKPSKYTELFKPYHPERKDRLGKGGGGLMFLIHPSITYTKKLLRQYPTGNLEVQCITIKMKTSYIDILNFYNPPDPPTYPKKKYYTIQPN